MFVAFSIPSSWYLLLSYPCITPPHFPLPTGNHLFVLYVHESAFVFLLHSLSCRHFLESTYKWYHTLFVFLYLIYFTKHNILWVHLCFWKWQNFILFMVEEHSIVCVCVCVCVCVFRHTQTVSSLSSCLLVRIWIASMCWLLQIVLQWTLGYICLN